MHNDDTTLTSSTTRTSPPVPAAVTDHEVLLDDVARRCAVTYVPHFLTRANADALFEFLCTSTPFQAEAPVMFGRAVEVRRRTYSYGESGTRYRYAGVERVAAPWPAELTPTVERVRAFASARFTFALCNLYPDGAAGLGWHADDVRDLVAGAPIAALSLGAERDFQMRLGQKGPAVLSVSLGHGSLLLMHGATQEHYQHQVPKRARCTSPRVNLTFRVMR